MTLHELSERLAGARTALSNLGMANSPIDPAERLKMDARYQLARDAVSRLESEYQRALGKLSTEELLQIANV